MTTISLNPTLSLSKESAPARRYHSYLLRIWREDEQTPWRIQVENPHTHEVIGFQSLPKLKAFLDEQFLNKRGDDTDTDQGLLFPIVLPPNHAEEI